MDSQERGLEYINNLAEGKLRVLDRVGDLIDNAKREEALTPYQANILRDLKRVIEQLINEVASLQKDYAARNTGPA